MLSAYKELYFFFYYSCSPILKTGWVQIISLTDEETLPLKDSKVAKLIQLLKRELRQTEVSPIPCSLPTLCTKFQPFSLSFLTSWHTGHTP